MIAPVIRRLADRARGRRGLALVAVLWVLVLLALIAASFTRTTRTEINLARNQAESARAEALADAGVYRALYGLIRNDPDELWRTDGTAYAWTYGGGELRIVLQDEGGKVDLNRASDTLLTDLFIAAGLEAEQAEALTDAVRDFADGDDLRRLDGAEDRDYEAAGLPWGAKDAPFQAVEELRQVLGVTPAIYEALAPALTVHARAKKPKEANAPPLVRAALAGRVLEEEGDEEEGDDGEGEVLAAPGALGAEEGKESGAEVEAEAGGPRLLAGDEPAEGGAAPLAPRSRARVFTIQAEAKLPSGAVFVRQALVRLGGGGSRPYQIEGWKQGKRVLFPVERVGAGE